MLFKPSNIKNKYQVRREIVFIVLSGIFIGTLAMLNILGISRELDLSLNIFGFSVPFRVFIGVLPYPVTFLCTDLISELYGKRRATYVVWTGLLLNIWVVFILWIGGILPKVPQMDPTTGLPFAGDPAFVFFQIRHWTFSATLASMIAYLTAQLVDVQVFHFLNKKAVKKLWLRNNVSTLTSQMVDSFSVVLITYFTTNAINVDPDIGVMATLSVLIISTYVFKFIAALVDTIPFYIGVNILSKYLNIDPAKEGFVI